MLTAFDMILENHYEEIQPLRRPYINPEGSPTSCLLVSRHLANDKGYISSIKPCYFNLKFKNGICVFAWTIFQNGDIRKENSSRRTN